MAAKTDSHMARIIIFFAFHVTILYGEDIRKICLTSSGFHIEVAPNTFQVLREVPSVSYSKNYTIGSDYCLRSSACSQPFPQGRHICNFKQSCTISVSEGSIPIDGCGLANRLTVNIDTVYGHTNICSGKRTNQQYLYIGSPGLTDHIPIYNFNCQCVITRTPGVSTDPTVAIQSLDTRLSGEGCSEQQLTFTDGANRPIRNALCPPKDFAFMQFASQTLKQGDELKVTFTQTVVNQNDKGIFIMFLYTNEPAFDVECTSYDVDPPPEFEPTPASTQTTSTKTGPGGSDVPILELAVGLAIGGVALLSLAIGLAVFFGLRRRKSPPSAPEPTHSIQQGSGTQLQDNDLYHRSRENIPQTIRGANKENDYEKLGE